MGCSVDMSASEATVVLLRIRPQALTCDSDRVDDSTSHDAHACGE
jgi:hypothetical protein